MSWSLLQPLSSASNGTVCRVNPTLVRGYFLPYRTSQFLLAVRRALTSTANTNLCAVFVSRFDWQCGESYTPLTHSAPAAPELQDLKDRWCLC